MKKKIEDKQTSGTVAWSIRMPKTLKKRIAHLPDSDLGHWEKRELAKTSEAAVTGSAHIRPPKAKRRNKEHPARNFGDPTWPKKVCIECKNDFYTKRSKQRFCSFNCGSKFRIRKYRENKYTELHKSSTSTDLHKEER